MRLFVFFILITLCACQTATSPQPTAAVLRIDKPEFATGFEIQLLADSTWLILLFDHEHPGDTLQKIHWQPRQITRVGCASTTHISMLDKLHRLNDVKGAAYADRILNPNAKRLYQQGEIRNLSTGYELEPELVYSMEPQLLFVYPFGGANYNKYLQRGIGCVQISEYMEKHPLGRAEWIKVFGTLLNEEARADSVFNAIKHEYLTLKKLTDSQSNQKPTVFYGSYANSYWYSPPGNSFIATLINDAGGRYIFTDSTRTGNITLAFEQMYEQAYSLDYWGKIVYDSETFTLNTLAQEDSRLTKLNAYQKKNIYYCNAATTDYHGDALMEPQVLLSDLIYLFQPQLLPHHKPIYFLRAHE